MFFDLFKKKNKENAKIQELEQTIRNLSAELEAVKRSISKDEKPAKPEAISVQKIADDQKSKNTVSVTEKQPNSVLTPKTSADDPVIEERKIRSLAELKDALLPYIKLHGGNRTIVEDLVKYIYAKLGSNIYNQGKWYFSNERIEYRYYWGSCSFFDDGGCNERLMNWTMSVYHGTDTNFENHRLTDLSDHSRFHRTDESFICKDPFGLVGLFEFHYILEKN